MCEFVWNVALAFSNIELGALRWKNGLEPRATRNLSKFSSTRCGTWSIRLEDDHASPKNSSTCYAAGQGKHRLYPLKITKKNNATDKAIFNTPYKITCKDKVICNRLLGYLQSLKITPSLENSLFLTHTKSGHNERAHKRARDVGLLVV